ncbi:zinc finger domain-containing protein [Mycobacteroides abscessus]|uniref:zinc finger domain-containing protein n=1 Tax=Mycobacteroides abscessus TaxID=36809 RepID=UPI003B439DA7
MRKFGGALADYYDETGSLARPTAYTVTGADLRDCPECGEPAGFPCRWPDGRRRNMPCWSRWHPQEVA